MAARFVLTCCAGPVAFAPGVSLSRHRPNFRTAVRSDPLRGAVRCAAATELTPSNAWRGGAADRYVSVLAGTRSGSVDQHQHDAVGRTARARSQRGGLLLLALLAAGLLGGRLLGRRLL